MRIDRILQVTNLRVLTHQGFLHLVMLTLPDWSVRVIEHSGGFLLMENGAFQHNNHPFVHINGSLLNGF